MSDPSADLSGDGGLSGRQVPRGCLARGRGRRAPVCAALAALLGIASVSHATTYPLPRDGEGVIGKAFYAKSQQEQTLLDIGRPNDLGLDEMSQANPGIDPWLPKEGGVVTVPTLFILPDAPRSGIILNLAEKRMYFYPLAKDGGAPVVSTYPVSIGREGWDTPTGSFRISEKKKDPEWRPPATIRAEHAAKGDILPDVIPAGPDNPLGQYALRLSTKGSYLIHGTNKPWGMGMELSHGCIRMYPEDIEALFPVVPANAPVTIIRQPYKAGWRGDELFFEVHANGEQDMDAASQVIKRALDGNKEAFVDWDLVRTALSENTGLPRVVGGRRAALGKRYLDIIF